MKLKGECIRLKQGQTLIKRGDSCDNVYELRKGRLKCVRQSGDGRYCIEEWLESPAVFGLTTLFGRVPQFPYMVSVDSPFADIKIVKKSVLWHSMGKDEHLRAEIMNILSTRVQKAENVIWDSRGEDVLQRFVDFLKLRILYLPGRKLLRVNMFDLSRLLNVTPKKVSAMLHDLEKKNLLRLTRSKIEIDHFENLIRP